MLAGVLDRGTVQDWSGLIGDRFSSYSQLVVL